MFSPDGRWIKYDSNESGRFEVYAAQFPGPGGKWQISTEDGTESWWNADGSELMYLAPDLNMMRVDIETSDTLTVGLPEPLFGSLVHPAIERNHDVVTRDAQRFLILQTLGREAIYPTTVILNWTETLRR